MKVYVLGLQHTLCTPDFTTCAFTMKAYYLCKMLRDRGHEVIFLGVEGSNPPCSENVPLVSRELWEAAYGGHPGKNFYDLDTTGLKGDLIAEFDRRAREELDLRRGADQTEIVCCPWGVGHAECVKDIEPHQPVVESGVGYPLTFAQFRVFESYAWMHTHYGKEGKWGGETWYDAVIPNAFDPEAFTFRVASERGDYFLYFGRLVEAKGVRLAIQVAKECGRRIIICGQGDPRPFTEGEKHVEYREPVGREGRNELLGRAALCLVPTYYIEPWGGVNVEAQATGCPVLTTDWGVFPETVLHGVTGFRCRTFEQFVWAAKAVLAGAINRDTCRDWAIENFSLGRVALMYEEYFRMLLDHGFDGQPDGFYRRRPERENLDWLRRFIPLSAAAWRYDRLAPGPGAKIKEERAAWLEAQAWERKWWGDDPDAPHWKAEQEKQDFYAEQMLLGKRDFSGKHIVDVGGGPMSLLLRCKHDESAVIDPMAMPGCVCERYKVHGIATLPLAGEELSTSSKLFYDEAWCYNVLQHVENPATALANLCALAPTVRIFEWLHVPTSPGHLHSLNELLFKWAFPPEEWAIVRWQKGRKWDTDYLAIVARRKGTP
jgi:hypothetical protein